jgi:dTDP-glucose 4,6-dehydratase
MDSVLVTGGAGFIGANFVIYLLKNYEGIKVVNVDKLTYAGNMQNLKEAEGDPRHVFCRADICDREAIDRLFAEHDIDTVINFAAESHVDRSIDSPEVFLRTNVMGAASLLDAARAAWEQPDGSYRYGVRFLQVSTDEVYGSLGPEGFFEETTPLAPHSPYSASKAAADLIVKAYGDTYGVPVNITRCSNNYGPFQFPEKLIPLMINNALNGVSLPVYGDGMQVRDWLYVEDHCRAIDMVARKAKPGEIYNVGGHNERTNIAIVRTIIAYLRDRAGVEADESLIKHVEDRKGHDRRYGINPAKIRRELGWYPETAFEEGIVKTIQWYLDNKKWVEDAVSGGYKEYYSRMYGGK